MLPSNWNNGADLGEHPKKKDIPRVLTLVNTKMFAYIKQLEDDDLEEQAMEAEDNGDAVEAEMIRDEKDEPTPIGGYCNVEVSAHAVKKYLKLFVQQNVVWDLGLQMQYINSTSSSTSKTGARLTHQCYCPCSSIFRAWQEKLNFPSVLCQEALECNLNKQSNNPREFVQHLVDKSNSSCVLHRTFLYYLQTLYPEQTKFVTAKTF